MNIYLSGYFCENSIYAYPRNCQFVQVSFGFHPFVRYRTNKSETYRDCCLVKSGQCRARVSLTAGDMVLLRGPTELKYYV